jgi:hypothetical protein
MWFLVAADDDQILAAEPGFPGDPPECGGGATIAERQLSGHYSELVEQQPENGVASTRAPPAATAVTVRCASEREDGKRDAPGE